MEPNLLVEFQPESLVSYQLLNIDPFNKIIGEHRYELFRIERRVNYARYWYFKQGLLTKMSTEVPDIVNAFGVMAKEDTSHGFPVARPLERNSDWALYNINSEGWFQCWSLLSAIAVVSFWFYISDF